MAWKPQGGGGPWGGGGGNGGGPWGSGGGPTGGGSQQPPDIEEMLRRSKDNMKNIVPGGFGSGRAIGLAIIAALVLWMASGIYRVDAGHQGVVMLFGKHVPGENATPGLHWYFPAPIGKVLTPNVEAVRRIDVGFRAAGDTAAAFGRTASVGRDVLEEHLESHVAEGSIVGLSKAAHGLAVGNKGHLPCELVAHVDTHSECGITRALVHRTKRLHGSVDHKVAARPIPLLFVDKGQFSLLVVLLDDRFATLKLFDFTEL